MRRSVILTAVNEAKTLTVNLVQTFDGFAFIKKMYGLFFIMKFHRKMSVKYCHKTI